MVRLIAPSLGSVFLKSASRHFSKNLVNLLLFDRIIGQTHSSLYRVDVNWNGVLKNNGQFCQLVATVNLRLLFIWRCNKIKPFISGVGCVRLAFGIGIYLSIDEKIITATWFAADIARFFFNETFCLKTNRLKLWKLVYTALIIRAFWTTSTTLTPGCR